MNKYYNDNNINDRKDAFDNNKDNDKSFNNNDDREKFDYKFSNVLKRIIM